MGHSHGDPLNGAFLNSNILHYDASSSTYIPSEFYIYKGYHRTPIHPMLDSVPYATKKISIP